MQFIIRTRLNNYKQHFKYLFNINSQYALKTRYIEVTDYNTIIKGTIEHILDQMKEVKSLYSLNPVDIYLDNIEYIGDLYTLYNVKSSDELFDLYKIKIPSNVKTIRH